MDDLQIKNESIQEKQLLLQIDQPPGHQLKPKLNGSRVLNKFNASFSNHRLNVQILRKRVQRYGPFKHSKTFSDQILVNFKISSKGRCFYTCRISPASKSTKSPLLTSSKSESESHPPTRGFYSIF